VKQDMASGAERDPAIANLRGFAVVRAQDGGGCERNEFTLFDQQSMTGRVDTVRTNINSPIEHGLAGPKAAQCFSFDAPVERTILTQADEINAHGQIVGVYTGADEVWHAFLMVGATFTSFDFPGATGTGAYGINSAGQIVGKYFGADGSTHGFLADPPRRENRSSCSMIPELGDEIIAEGFLARRLT
jgi:hypothetical protein